MHVKTFTRRYVLLSQLPEALRTTAESALDFMRMHDPECPADYFVSESTCEALLDMARDDELPNAENSTYQAMLALKLFLAQHACCVLHDEDDI
jgi:hypothetical protein